VKIQLLVKNQDFYENPNLGQKLNFFCKSNFWSKIKKIENRTFGQKSKLL